MRKVSVLLVLFAALAMFAAPAQAAVSFTLHVVIQNSGGTIYDATGTVNNLNSSGIVVTTATPDAGNSYTFTYNPATETISFNGTDSHHIQINDVATSTSNDPFSALQTVNGLQVKNGSSSPITVQANSSFNGYSITPGNNGSGVFLSSLTTDVGNQGAITFNSQYAGNGGANASLTPASGVTGQGGFYSTSTSVPVQDPFTLSSNLTEVVANGKQGDANGSTQLTTPEPATMTLWGIGLAACGFAARRRRNAKVA